MTLHKSDDQFKILIEKFLDRKRDAISKMYNISKDEIKDINDYNMEVPFKIIDLIKGKNRCINKRLLDKLEDSNIFFDLFPIKLFIVLASKVYDKTIWGWYNLFWYYSFPTEFDAKKNILFMKNLGKIHSEMSFTPRGLLCKNGLEINNIDNFKELADGILIDGDLTLSKLPNLNRIGSSIKVTGKIYYDGYHFDSIEELKSFF